MVNSRARNRKVDVEKLSNEDAQRISDELGNRLKKISDDACAQANLLVNPYGLKVLMQFAVQPKESLPNKE